MHRYIRQAKHNHDFHDCLIEHFPKQYFDWKVTVIFYIALHGLNAFLLKQRQPVSNTHYDTKNKVTALIRQHRIPMTETEWKIYNLLYQSSHNARYDGVLDTEQSFEMALEIDYLHCTGELIKFNTFLSKHGISI